MAALSLSKRLIVELHSGKTAIINDLDPLHGGRLLGHVLNPIENAIWDARSGECLDPKDNRNDLPMDNKEVLDLKATAEAFGGPTAQPPKTYA